MKRIILILLISVGCLAAPALRAVDYTNIQTKPTADPRVNIVYGLVWGSHAEAMVFGPTVPKGKVWIIETCGIATYDGRSYEWMMQVAVMNPFGTGGWWLVPAHRQPGYASGTPVLATDRRIVLSSGRALVARVNGMEPNPEHPGNQMALLFDGWEVDEEYLGCLLGLSGLDQMNPAQSSMNREILGLESQLNGLGK